MSAPHGVAVAEPAPSTVLAQIDAAKAMLAEVQEPIEAAQLVRQADALAYLTRKAKLSEDAQRAAAEVALRAKRRAGELLAEAELDRGGRPPKTAVNMTEVSRPPKLENLGIGENDSRRWQAIAKVPEERFEEYLAEAETPTTSGLLSTAHVAHNSGESEWYTPAEVIEVARAVMGGIDLDPASTAEANEVVKAERFYTAEDDGLSLPWYGRVWLNPPYAQPWVALFVERLVQAWHDGEIEQACCLVNNATETAWGAVLLRHASLLCFPTGRVRFWSPGREAAAPLQGQMLAYFGSATHGFHELGPCAVPEPQIVGSQAVAASELRLSSA